MGGLEFQVGSPGLADFGRRLEGWAKGQLPFATAAALTDVARAARDDVGARLSRHFRLRNVALRRNVVRYLPASKRDRPPRSVVYVPEWASFMALHVTGGVKRGHSGARVAVPTRITVRKRGATGRIPKRFKPRSLRERKGLEREALARGKLIVHGVKGAGGAIFFHLVSSAKIRPRWPIVEEVGDAVRRELPGAMERRLEQALSTS